MPRPPRRCRDSSWRLFVVARPFVANSSMNLFAVNGHLARGADAYPDLIALHTEDGERDLGADHDFSPMRRVMTNIESSPCFHPLRRLYRK